MSEKRTYKLVSDQVRAHCIDEIARAPLGKVDSLCRSLGLSKAAVRARASRRGNDYVSALRSVGVEVSAPEDAWA